MRSWCGGKKASRRAQLSGVEEMIVVPSRRQYEGYAVLVSKPAITNTVGAFQRFLSVLVRALRRVPPFRSRGRFCCPNPKPARNRFSGQEFSSAHACLHSQ